MTPAHQRTRRSRWRRGDHRQNGFRFTPADLIAEVFANAPDTRRAHQRSLRRPFDPGPIFLGTTVGHLRFYVPDAEVGTATLTIAPSESLTVVPALFSPPPFVADDAPTGPITLTEGAA